MRPKINYPETFTNASTKAGCNVNPDCHARGLTEHTAPLLHRTANSSHT